LWGGRIVGGISSPEESSVETSERLLRSFFLVFCRNLGVGSSRAILRFRGGEAGACRGGLVGSAVVVCVVLAESGDTRRNPSYLFLHSHFTPLKPPVAGGGQNRFFPPNS
jgi:hypothetical protein